MNLKYYLITDPEYYSSDVHQFEDNLRKTLQNKTVHLACFRDKTSSNYEALATVFVKVCQEFKIERILLNEHLELASKLQCGIHLTSTQFDKIKDAKALDRYVIVSCHTHNEIKQAMQLGANAVTYSPIFTTPNKGEPKGIEDFKTTLSLFDIPIIALGGIIHQEHIQQIEQTKAYGFASIRYFLDLN